MRTPLPLGKTIRLNRLLRPAAGRSLIVTLDHGLTQGPLPGLVPARSAVEAAAQGGADAALMHKGLAAQAFGPGARGLSLIVHLSAGTDLAPDATRKILATTVEEAVSLGADAVSVHVNLGNPHEADMLADLGRAARQASRWGMPLMAMVYARGPGVADPFHPDVVAHAARVGMELGADLVKVPYTGDAESFARVTAGCGVPVFIAGGPRAADSREFFRMVRGALQAGCAGLSAGRNIFQHARPQAMIRALAGMIHQGWDVDQALHAVGET